ncbi:CYFA0S28e00474g1_1 [Cyberlindnera fabianii]|uniref:Large ribosomal subunit protein mL67 n=1 Tax=Cyberlindnera fabianii TaxID=36022 RepID=A0A061BCP0_CYBFA|nr:Mitochondrial ous recombination protein 1 [Cyberlindnera fabianii]CDR47086.1 CYFA0S28e00474g1_1 [Cyberlindnera fabianii]
MSNRFRTANWLAKNGYGPQVFLFRNIESGQVLYSQLPTFTDYQLKVQFQRPNWENRKPSLRRDIWRIMAVSDFESYEAAVEAYETLVRLRSMRDLTLKDVAMRFRPRNKDGNIWYSAQFRPVYTQEAVSDLATTIDHIQSKTKIHWEDEWRKGDLSNWDKDLVEHELMDRVALHTPKALLEDLRQRARAEFKQLRAQEAAIEGAVEQRV